MSSSIVQAQNKPSLSSEIQTTIEYLESLPTADEIGLADWNSYSRFQKQLIILGFILATNSWFDIYSLEDYSLVLSIIRELRTQGTQDILSSTTNYFDRNPTHPLSAALIVPYAQGIEYKPNEKEN